MVENTIQLLFLLPTLVRHLRLVESFPGTNTKRAYNQACFEQAMGAKDVNLHTTMHTRLVTVVLLDNTMVVHELVYTVALAS